MAEIKQVDGSSESPTHHVILFHGLGGTIDATWQYKKGNDDAFPRWLAEDLTTTAVWKIGYDAASMRWTGQAMHITDRARNLMSLLLTTPALHTGEIALIGHSMGGLIIKALIRALESTARNDQGAQNFLTRIRKVGFLATPHFGSGLAVALDVARLVFRPSAATAGLIRHDPNLRELNNWYRSFSRANTIKHLVLVENRVLWPIGLRAVNIESSDPGIEVDAIHVDCDHRTICKPSSRRHEVYLQLLHFLGTVPNDASADSADNVLARLSDLLAKSALSDGAAGPTAVIDQEIQTQLRRLRQSRLYGHFPIAEAATQLYGALANGALRMGSDRVRGTALAWCARLLSRTNDYSIATQALQLAEQLVDAEEIVVARAFIASVHSDWTAVTTLLAPRTSALAMSARFRLICIVQDENAGLRWLSAIGLLPSFLDVETRSYLMNIYLKQGQWDAAYALALDQQDADFVEVPTLLAQCGVALLVHTMPEQVRRYAASFPPFDLSDFRLADDKAARAERQRARDLFRKASVAARALSIEEHAEVCDDFALWIDLRDPDQRDSALQTLQAGLRDARALRWTRFAVQFGVKIDTALVERAIEQDIARRGDISLSVSFAHLALSQALLTPAAKAAHIKQHRGELLANLHPEGIALLEVQSLVHANNFEGALAVLDDYVREHHLTTEQASDIRQRSQELQGPSATEIRIKAFEESGKLLHLVELVGHLMNSQDSSRLAMYAAQLFSETRAADDAEVLVKVLSELRRYAEIDRLLDDNSSIVQSSVALRYFLAISYFRRSRFAEASVILQQLGTRAQHGSLVDLSIRIAISSGHWEELAGIIENVWHERGDCSAADLIIVAKLAFTLSLPRAKELTEQAAARGDDDPTVLCQAYMIAMKAGWAGKAETLWLKRAADLSGDSGPVQRFSLKDLVEQNAGTNDHTKEVWNALEAGIFNIAGSGVALNRSIAELTLVPSIRNVDESDTRRRFTIPSFSGDITLVSLDSLVIGFDASSLLTLGRLGLIQQAINSVKTIVLPHSTFAWLFDERQKFESGQATRLLEAQRLTQLIARGGIKIFSPSVVAAPALADEVGASLAVMLSEAAYGERRSVFVVRSSPVYTIGSLMEKRADLSAFSSVLLGCLDVIAALRNAAVITEEEEETAHSYLHGHEELWPNATPIPAQAVLLLDDLSVSYLHTTRILEKLVQAGYEIYVTQDAVDECTDTLSQSEVSNEVQHVLEQLRKSLLKGITDGKVEVAPFHEPRQDDEKGMRRALELLRIATHVDAVMVDDRFWNVHKQMEEGGKRVFIFSSTDLLYSLLHDGCLTALDIYRHLTLLRRSGYILVPATSAELFHYLDSARVANSQILENAELKAFRQYMQRISLGKGLVFPRDIPWLEGLFLAVISTVKAIWVSTDSAETAKAKSTWLAPFLDSRRWAFFVARDHSGNWVRGAYAANVARLIHPHPAGLDEARLDTYFAWVVETLVEPLEMEDHRTYRRIGRHIAELIVASRNDLRQRAA